MALSTRSRIDSLLDRFGSGWSHAFPQRYRHVMLLREPCGPDGFSGMIGSWVRLLGNGFSSGDVDGVAAG